MQLYIWRKGLIILPLLLLSSLITATAEGKTLVNGGFETGNLKGWTLVKDQGGLAQVEPKTDNPHTGNYSLYYKVPPKNQPQGKGKTFDCFQEKIDAVDDFVVTFWYYIVDYGAVGNVCVRIDGYDGSGVKKAVALYYWGGDSWDHGDARPDQTGGYYHTRVKLDSRKGEWLYAEVKPQEDFERAHGNVAKWDDLGIQTFTIVLRAWVFELNNNFIEGYCDDITTPGSELFSVNYQDRLSTTWGNIKAQY